MTKWTEDLTSNDLLAMFDAQTILIAIVDNTPIALTIEASRLFGRKASGDLGILTGAEVLAILSGQAAADFSMNTKKITSVTDPTSNQDAATKKYVDDSDDALDYGLSFEGIVTTATDSTHFKVSTLAGKGVGFFIPGTGDPYEIYVVQADGAAPEGQHKPVVAYTSSDGTFEHDAFTTNDLAVGDIVLIIHPWLARMLDLYTDWKDGGRLDLLIDAIITDIASAVPEPPTAKSLQDILHKDTSYTYDNTRHSLEAIGDEIHEMHAHAHILFVTPEAVASITADNIVIKAELVKLGEVDHIVQTDALDFPNFTIYDLCVMGSNNGNAWTTSNLADIKVVPMLPLLCFDKVAAAYLEMGTDGGDATTKTTIDVTAKIEGSELGIGASYFSITGLVVGVQTISSEATYHTLNMENANLSEIVYATADIDVDAGNGGTPQSDVVLGWLPAILENGTIGLDEAGEELPATIAFFGAGFEANKLTTLGKAVIYLCAHILVQAQKKPLEVAGTIQNLRRLIFGNMGGQFTNTAPLVEWIAGENTAGTKLPAGTSLVDLINTVDGIVDTLLTRVTAAVATATALATVDGIVDNILIDTAVIGALGAGLTNIPWNSAWDTEVQSEATDALNAYDPPTRTEATSDKDAVIAAMPTGLQLSSDWKGSFSFTTGYGTTDTDISNLFSTNLALTTRRKYSVKLDLTAIETDGNFTELYLSVNEKIDGTNYRAIDRKTITKANIGTTAEPGIIIEIPATSENIQIKIQMAVGLAANRTIYYAVVKEHLE